MISSESNEREDQPSEPQRPSGTSWNTETERAAAIETAIQQAIRQGAFDDLPGAGKPLDGLGHHHDPDWWIRRKILTEKLDGLGPAALTLRVEDERMESTLDALRRESDVREHLEDFNNRVTQARRQLLGGPPVVTNLRDVERDVAAWRSRRDSAVEQPTTDDDSAHQRRRWFKRRT